MSSLTQEKIIYKGLQVPLFTKKGFPSTDKSTAVFPIVLENEEPVYLCLCSSFGDSIVDYEGDCFLPANSKTGRKVISRNENILTNTTTTFNSNRFTKKTDVRKELKGYAISDYQKRSLLKKAFLRKWDLFAWE